jgi:ABC-type transport system involved in cytochrome c biogenesis ATPase subunit
MNKIIHLENLDFYGNNNELIFSIKDPIAFNGGDIVYIKADNASGKTTLLKFVSGLLEKNRVKKNSNGKPEAKLFINPQNSLDLLSLSPKEENILRVEHVSFFLDKVGNAPKSYPFEKALTFPIDENSLESLDADEEKRLKKEKDELIGNFSEWFLKGKAENNNLKILKQNWTRLSAGQQQALFIMQTLLKASILKTKITILDEPLNYFSYENRKHISKLILNFIQKKLNPDGIVMLVSHQKDFEELYVKGLNKKISKIELLDGFNNLLQQETLNFEKVDNLIGDLLSFLNKVNETGYSRSVRIFTIKDKRLSEL